MIRKVVKKEINILKNDLYKKLKQYANNLVHKQLQEN